MTAGRNDEILTRWNLEKILTNRVRGIDSNPHTKNRVGRDKDYIASFKWLNSVKNYLTKREYDRFIYSVIIPMIREDKSLSKSQKKEITKKYAQSIALRNKFHFGYIVENLKPLYLNFSNKE